MQSFSKQHCAEARSHHEKELNLTMVIECNKKLLLVEEPTDAELRRIIYF